MSFCLRRGFPVLILLAAIFVVGCEAESRPTPRATWTPKPSATPEPTETATPISTHTPIPSSTPRTAAQLNLRPGAASDINPAPQPGGARDPLIPVLGPFPPVAIPARPANINPLTGTSASAAALQRRPIVVRIGNDTRVYQNLWHSGLYTADIVFEELIDSLGTQYATTRYSAIYLSNDPPLIGPVRSGRIINLQIAPMLDGALSHAGGSDGTRWIFSQTPLVNLDEAFNRPAYCYEEQTRGYQGRLYTTGARLREWLAQKGWEKAVPLYGFNFSTNVPSGQSVTMITASKLPVASLLTYQWKYDSPSGSYLRYINGSPHIDSSYSVTAKWGNSANCVKNGTTTQSHIRAQNIIALYARHEKTNITEDTNNAVSVYIPLVGQGDAIFFRDGQMVRGKWQRKSEQEFFNFTDSAGIPYALKPGNTWFEILPIGYALELK